MPGREHMKCDNLQPLVFSQVKEVDEVGATWDYLGSLSHSQQLLFFFPLSDSLPGGKLTTSLNGMADCLRVFDPPVYKSFSDTGKPFTT